MDDQRWGHPRAPLPPHRLAKLANALGVPTPLPPHLGNSPPPDSPWRTLSPSPAPQSKYLLHVIPPPHLPHEVHSSDAIDLAPPPSNASGYHTQFRRGTLVTLQSTLHAQLLVIAREYALPSTIGIVLYLVTPPPQSRQNSPMPPASPICDTSGGEPGPRLSEEIWKHIWARVLRAERDEVIALSRSGTPNPFGLGLSVEPSTLRPLLTPTRTEQPRPLAYPITPSTSTGSCVSDSRSHEKSAGTSLLSEPNTPDTSQSSDNGPPGIDLPGLNSQSIIPILAKVEFDIDRRKATWYEPWVRTRRTKRTDSRSSHRSDSQSRTLDSSSPADEKRAPYDLKLVQRMQKPPFLRSQHDFDQEEQPENAEYALLSESPDADADAYMTSSLEHDPLGDVFGTDADTWTEIHADPDSVRRKVNNPNVVELALDATSLTTFPEQSQEESVDSNDIAEVRDIMQRKLRPSLGISIPGSPESKRKSPLSTARPTPLVLVPKSPTNDLIDENPDSAVSRDKEGSSFELEQEYQRSRSTGEEKRVGTLFEDLDLGLDLGDDDEEYNENDPNDRRRSQYLMKAKLDEIERALAQFSPRQLKTANLEEDTTMAHHRNLSSTSQLRTPVEPAPSPLRNAWPSVPYSSVSKSPNGSPLKTSNLPPSTPILALNGVSTGAPKAFMPTPSPSSTLPSESQLRRRELDLAIYPGTPTREANIAASDSPIPLSPDPFGRHPSLYEADTAPVQSYWDPVTQKVSYEPPGSSPSVSSIDDSPGSLPPTTPVSRFSADSSGVVDQGDRAKATTPLVSVKGLKKLWRRSKSSSNAVPQPPTPARTSFHLPSSPQPQDQFIAPPVPWGANGKPHAGQLQIDHSSRPSLSGSRPNLPAAHLNALPQEKPTVRKSILKSWKSVTGATSQLPVNGSDPRKSAERSISNETIKARRPSILDSGIPPSPQLPDQYLASNHVRTGSNFLEQRKSTGWAKTGPGHHSSASHDLLSAPPAWFPASVQMPGPPSPSQLQDSATSRDSRAESRTSPETSQSSNLTYPYMTLDHE